MRLSPCKFPNLFEAIGCFFKWAFHPTRPRWWLVFGKVLGFTLLGAMLVMMAVYLVSIFYLCFFLLFTKHHSIFDGLFLLVTGVGILWFLITAVCVLWNDFVVPRFNRA